MSALNQRTLYVLTVLLMGGLLFIGQKTLGITSSASATLTNVGTVSPPAQAECSYDPSSALKVEPQQLVSFQDPMLGNAESNVTVVEFFDPNCSHCQALHPTMKEVISKYEDKVKFYLKPFPLWKISLNQIEAMVLAAEENKFYEMIDLQLAQGETSGLSNEQLVALADSLNMDTEKFSQALRSNEARRQALYYRKQGEEFGLRSTPTVVINGRVVAGQSRTVNCISELLDEQLAQTSN